MKYSLNWLQEMLDLPLEGEELARRLPGLGFGVEGLQKTGPAFKGVVVGKVLKVDKHPNADRLSLCEVTDGTNTFSIVCGAKNVAAGQHVPVARIGAVLPGGFKIEKTKIRGVESQGMICSSKELGLGNDHEGILVLDAKTALGTDFAALAGKPDTLFELEITPNRPDVLSHYGLARELALALGGNLKSPISVVTSPLAGEGRVGGHSFPIKIEDSEACPRYLGRTISNVKVGPSPAWMAERLTACGLRPINNIVDVTNYVLLELGHPLHAFDQALLHGGIVVRRAKHDELFKALDGREHVLEEADLVIADHRRPMALAGVIGGTESGITEKTSTVFLETAYFKPAGIRKTARRLRIRTDSSYRFERGTDPLSLEAVNRRAAQLILETSGPQATLSKAEDVYPKELRPPTIRVSLRDIDAKLGTELEAAQVEKILAAFVPQGGRLESGPGELTFTPPSFRVDLLGFEDAAEEVARLVGYDKIPSTPEPAVPAAFDPPPLQAWTMRLQDRLVSLGFSEAFTYDFVSAKELQMTDRVGESEAALDRTLPRLENPVSNDWVHLRPNLLHGLLRSLARNVNRGAETVLLFEAGRTYSKDRESSSLAGVLAGKLPAGVHWQEAGRKADFFALKGVLQSLFAGEASLFMKETSVLWLHPKLCAEIVLRGQSVGLMGQVHPAVTARWEVPESWYFELNLERLPAPPAWAKALRPFTQYPTSKRDLSFTVPEETAWAEVFKKAKPAAGAELLALELVDVFAGKGIAAGRKSLTLRMTLGAMDRTLSDAEIQAAVERVLKALAGLGAELRT